MHVLDKEMATHSSVIAWRIPGTEDPDGLLSMGSHRVRHDWHDLAAAAAAVAEVSETQNHFSDFPKIMKFIADQISWYQFSC